MIICKDINKLINYLNKDKIICFKTDTVWGFSALPNKEEHIRNLYDIKGRDSSKISKGQLDKQFVSLIKYNQDLNLLVKNINDKTKKLIKNFWPGPLTIIFEAKDNLDILSYYKEKATISIRMPKNELCQKILNNIDYPLPSTSVNKEGNPPLNDFKKITNEFQNEDFVIFESDLEADNNLSSTIVSAIGEDIKILREGKITKEEIFNCINND